MQPFKHKIEIQLRFKDVDMMGHVNNANYFSFAEVARLKYFDHVVGEDTDWHTQHGLILAHFDIDLRHAISYGDKVFVYTRCSRLGNKSFDLSFVMTIESGTDIITAAEGKSVIACYDYDLKASKEIPADRRKKIEEFEGLALGS